MKKINVILLAAAVAIMLASCTGSAPKAQLKTDVDTLSYAVGLERVEGLETYLVQQVGMDTAYMDEFMKGFLKGKDMISPKDVAYLEGMRIGQMVSNSWVDGLNRDVFMTDSTKTVNRNDMLAGFYDGLNKKGIMTTQEAQAYSIEKIGQIKEKAMLEKYGDNKAAGERFLEENKTKEGVRVTESGLQYKILKEGRGKVPAATSKVKVNYRGTLIDGTEFDSSYSRNQPASFFANRVIKGWTEALTMMPVGSKWELYIPQDLAYGSRAQSTIEPYSTLIFEVELLEIEQQ